MEAVAPLAWTWTIHASVHLATATLTTARFAGFEPPAVLIVTATGSVGCDLVMCRLTAKAMALAPASRWGLPSREPSRPAQCPSPSVEGECRPYPAEHSAWGSAIPEAWRSGLARESLWGLLWRELSRPAQYLYRLGEAVCRPHRAEREPARWWSMVMGTAMALAPASRWGSPCRGPSRAAQYPYPLREAGCRLHPAERSAWAGEHIEATRSART